MQQQKLALRDWILNWLERELKHPRQKIQTDETLLNYGMDSVNATMLVGDLEDHLGVRLSPTLLWDFQTVDSLAEELITRQGAKAPTVALAIDHDEAQQLLERLDTLTDVEVDALLQRLRAS